MSQQNLTTLNTSDDEFVVVRCKNCHKFLTEVTKEATGKIRLKCTNHKCKMINKISLPLQAISNSIFSGQNARTF